MKRLAILFTCLALVACGHKDEVHVTVTAGNSLDATAVSSIRTLEFAVLGDQPTSVRYGLSGELNDRQTTWIYRAGTKGRLEFEVIARNAQQELVGSGKSKIVKLGASAVAAKVTLENTPPNPNKGRLGETCTPGTDTCASGFCIEGICCESACDGACMTCNGAKPGTCTPQPSGSDPDDDCTRDAANPCGLDGTCNGAGSCRVTVAGSSCAGSTCSAGAFTGVAFCDGMGMCVVPMATSCAPYQCNVAGNACATICAGDVDCAAPATCGTTTNTTNPPGSCGKVLLGHKCAATAQCDSGTCIDGVCCSAPGPCGSCNSCAVPGHEGACAPVVSGAPDPSATCTDEGSGNCGTTGRCDGAGACAFYPAGTICAPGGCSADKTGYIDAATCKGDGAACTPPAPTSCAPYVCTTEDGAPGCQQDCGLCTFYDDPTKAPPFATSCATGATCSNDCLTATSWSCQ